MTTEVQYHCPKCDMNFVVYHSDDTRNQNCCWCLTPVTLTGQIRKIEGDEIITYKDGVEVGREPKKG